MPSSPNSTLQRISALATRSTHERFTVVGPELLASKSADAAANPRLREMHLFHESDASPLHRMLNAVEPGSYIRPHRHLHPPKAECFIILRGAAGFVFFDDQGRARDEDLVLLDAQNGPYAVDIRPGVWHALISLSPGAVLLECKNGPYDPTSDKDFAPWAPAPESPGATAWLSAMEARLRGRFELPEPEAHLLTSPDPLP